MITQLLWTKVGMSQVINEKWEVVPVTYVEIGGNEVIQVKTEAKDWYNALVIWANPYARPTKNKKFKDIVECKMDDVGEVAIWTVFWVDSFKDETVLTVTWVSKWKWFAWPVRRWNKHVIRQSHGTKYGRHWSTLNCCRTWRSRKGIKMAWRMWTDRVTLRGREIPVVDVENRVIWVKWPIPWPAWSLVILKKVI